MAAIFGNDVNCDRRDQTSKFDEHNDIRRLLETEDLLPDEPDYYPTDYAELEKPVTLEEHKRRADEYLGDLRRAERFVFRRGSGLTKAKVIISKLRTFGLKACKCIAELNSRVTALQKQLEAERRKGDGVQTSPGRKRQLLEKIAVLESENAQLAETIVDLELKLKLATLRGPQKRGALCGICRSQAPDIVFRPCRHLILCRECSRKSRFDKCPICDCPIAEVYQVDCA